jgi:hypothetical protein
MPKQTKDTKGKLKKTDVVTAQTDNEFDDILLAERCAADLVSPAASNFTTTTSASSNSNNPTPTARATRSDIPGRETVVEAKMVQACMMSDVSLLRRWTRRGIRVTTAEPLVAAAQNGQLEVVRLLVMELEANVTLLREGHTALCAAAQEGQEHAVQCLVQEFGADVNQAVHNGGTVLSSAAYGRHETVVRRLVQCGADVNQAG